MDNLVLIRAAAAIAPAVQGTVLRDILEDSPQRFRLVFEGDGRAATIVISLDPVLPWIGRPALRGEGARRTPGSFAGRVERSLVGLRVKALRKAGADRVVILDLADGQALVAELATHGANLVHVDAAGNVVGSARHPRKAHDRIGAGRPYGLPALPAGRLVPLGATAEALDACLRGAIASGEDLLEALRRRLFGVGTAGAQLVMDESLLSGRSPGEVLFSRLARLEAGELDPVVAGPEDPLAEAAAGRLDAGAIRLLPWEPLEPPAGCTLTRGPDPAATAGVFHEAIEKARRVAARTDALRGILKGEVRRLWDAERRLASDIERLGDPGTARRFGEALLAGLHGARRIGDRAWVSNPYDSEGGEIAVPAPADRTLPAAAEEHFHRARKVERGLEMARSRREGIGRRLERLEILEAQAESARGDEAAEKIEAALRKEGIPVGLGPSTRAGRAVARREPPRVEGVRLITSSDGLTILIGKTGRDNDRLTFKLAGPDDFWFHAAGVPGAHVVVRSVARGGSPPRATLVEAATAAAWFSDARASSQADVQWTRRKYVRRLRGAPPGTVVLKRFETIRVRPAPPAGMESEAR
jgi:predicted ribosome quality control (RQC) complex YloA/Tae2 family protein